MSEPVPQWAIEIFKRAIGRTPRHLPPRMFCLVCRTYPLRDSWAEWTEIDEPVIYDRLIWKSRFWDRENTNLQIKLAHLFRGPGYGGARSWRQHVIQQDKNEQTKIKFAALRNAPTAQGKD